MAFKERVGRAGVAPGAAIRAVMAVATRLQEAQAALRTTRRLCASTSIQARLARIRTIARTLMVCTSCALQLARAEELVVAQACTRIRPIINNSNTCSHNKWQCPIRRPPPCTAVSSLKSAYQVKWAILSSSLASPPSSTESRAPTRDMTSMPAKGSLISRRPRSSRCW